MGISHQRHFGWAVLAFLCFSGVPAPLDAQLFDGKLPRLFNRDRGETGLRGGSNGNGPSITFIQDLGIPTPRSTKVETLKGYEVTFEISAETKTPGMTVEFLVRQFPSAGKLVSLMSNPKNRSTARVTYYADPNSGATMDSFTFAVRYPGGKYSGIARCDIKIEDAQPKIEVSGAVDFGKLLIGEKERREIVVMNKGNAPYTRTLQLFSPWKVLKPADGKLAIAPGGQMRVEIGFEPTFGGAAAYELALSRGRNGVCRLSGEGLVPFTITGGEWELQLNPETGRREVDVIVKNNIPDPFEVYLRTSSRLQVQASESTVLIPGKENRIRVFLPENDVAAFDGGLELKLRSGFSEMTSVFGKTLPARMLIEVPGQLTNQVINFGKVTAGRSTERGIMVTNRGGELLAVGVSVEEPFRILGNLDRQLGPLETVPLSIGFFPSPEDRGKADQLAVFRSGDQEFRMRLVGNALRPPGAPRIPLPAPDPVPEPAPNPDRINPKKLSSSAAANRPPGNQAPQAGVPESDRPPAPPEKRTRPDDFWSREGSLTEVIKTLSPLGIKTRSIVDRDPAPGLRAAEDFQLLEADAKALEFGWTAPKGSEVNTFEVEVRGERINPATAMPESVWVPYEDVRFDRVGRLVKARVKGLQPFTVYEFRVFTIDQNGRSSPPSQPFASRTDRTMDWTYIYAGLGVIAAGLLGWALVKIVRERRGEVYQTELV